LNSWQQQCDEHADDGDDDQQLNEREGAIGSQRSVAGVL
jgi:hypothetical protein